MRVALLSHFYPPNHTAGIEQNTHSIARGLTAAGHQVHVLCCGSWAAGDTYFQGVTNDEWEGVPVRRLRVNWTKAPYPHKYLYDSPVMAAHVREFLVEFAPDVVHLTSMYTLSTSAIGAAKSLGLPVVFTLSDFWTICPRHTLMKHGGGICDGQVSAATCHDCLLSESAGYRSLKAAVPQGLMRLGVSAVLHRPNLSVRLPAFRGWGVDVDDRRRVMAAALRQVDCLITASGYVRDVVVGTGITPTIEVSHYGHELDWLNRYSRRTPDGTVHIGYIGQVVPIKGVDVLLDAFLSAGFGDRASLHIYGGTKDGSTAYERELRRKADGTRSVRFHGPYARPDLPQVLGNLDLIVVPSVWPDVAPLVVHEAFAAGLPVIASRVGGLPEFVREGHGGLVVEPGDRSALGSALRSIVDGGENRLSAMRAAIPAVRTRPDEVDFLVRTYERVRARCAPSPA